MSNTLLDRDDVSNDVAHILHESFGYDLEDIEDETEFLLAEQEDLEFRFFLEKRFELPCIDCRRWQKYIKTIGDVCDFIVVMFRSKDLLST